MTTNPIPKFLLQDHNFCSLSEKQKRDFLSRLFYIREISTKEIVEDEKVWSFIASLQIDIWSVLASYSVSDGESVLSVERWAAYVDRPKSIPLPALSRLQGLSARTPTIATTVAEVRDWLDDWTTALSETLDMIDAASDSAQGLMGLVAINCLLYVAMAFFSGLRLAGFRD